jgi:hypothetical protein
MMQPIGKHSITTGGNEDVVLKHLFGKNLAVFGFNETCKQLGTWQKWLQARSYQQDATSILSMVPLWNPSDDVCWRELMELGVDVLEMCLRMHQASVGKLATTSPFVIKIEAYLSAIAAFTIFAVFLTMLETIYFMKSMQCSL